MGWAIKKTTTALKYFQYYLSTRFSNTSPPYLHRANPTIPGSGAESLDKQQMEEVRYEFIPGVSQPTFLQIQRAAPELLATPGHHHHCKEIVIEDRVYVYENGLRAIVGQGVKDHGGVKYERKVVGSQSNS